MVIFEGMPPRRPLRNLVATGPEDALQEAGEVVKFELAAKGIVLDELDGGAAELVAKFHIVPADLPGEVVYEVPVGINARARDGVGCPNDGEARERNLGQAKVKGRGDAGVQADGRGIEAVFFRKK